ncbi:response regulator [Cohnella sp. 56]|uniref:response regulator n=1 Tax=Cohnella sp. 56 TaxID=3113722 RepID=UPI0030E7C65D
MIKVAVVDDKKLIRQGIVSLLRKAAPDIEIVAEFGNGAEALDFLRTEAVDLVVTDIRMPRMDGIALMEHARELPHTPKFIVLSEYDEFKYAQQSIEHGARAYILKPVDKAELIRVVARVAGEIERDQGIHQKEDQILAKEKKLMEEELRLALLSGIHSDAAMERLAQRRWLSGGSPFYVSLFLCDESALAQGGGPLPTGLSPAAQAHENMPSGEMLALELGRSTLILSVSEERIVGLADGLRRDGRCAAAAMSGPCADGRELRRGYAEAEQALKYRYLYPGRTMIRYADISRPHGDDPLPGADIDKLILLVGTGKLAQLDELLSRIFDRDTIVRNSIEYLEGTVKHFYAALADLAGALSHKGSEALKKYDSLGDLYHYDGMKSYLSSAAEFVRVLDHDMAAMKSAYLTSHEIEKAIAYMEKNYDKDISLTTVSNYVSMNYSYFSHLFRAKTGVSFVEYLRKIRIAKAMELLSRSQLKISEISDKVGFNSYKHFTRSFTESVGISPIEFREQKQTMEKMLEETTLK